MVNLYLKIAFKKYLFTTLFFHSCLLSCSCRASTSSRTRSSNFWNWPRRPRRWPRRRCNTPCSRPEPCCCCWPWAVWCAIPTGRRPCPWRARRTTARTRRRSPGRRPCPRPRQCPTATGRRPRRTPPTWATTSSRRHRTRHGLGGTLRGRDPAVAWRATAPPPESAQNTKQTQNSLYKHTYVS